MLSCQVVQHLAENLMALNPHTELGNLQKLARPYA